MATKTERVIIDSSALVALLKLDDTDHKKALKLMDKVLIKQKFLVMLPVEILAETLNILGKKLGKRIEIEAGQLLLDRIGSGELLLVAASTTTIRSALELRSTYSVNPSFIDCLVMALADEYKTRLVFGFDDTFRKNGYVLPS